MSDPNQEDNETPRDESEDRGPDNFFIDILTGNKESVSPKKLLVQKVLRQLIEGYGFNRHDIEVDYRHRIKGGKPAKIDIAIFQPGADHTNENLQRIIVCKTQKKREKLRSMAEAEADLDTRLKSSASWNAPNYITFRWPYSKIAWRSTIPAHYMAI